VLLFEKQFRRSLDVGNWECCPTWLLWPRCCLALVWVKMVALEVNEGQ
jgi:hypothetical protein